MPVAEGASLLHPTVDRFASVPLGSAGSRWVPPRFEQRRLFGTLSGSAAAHVAVLLLVLAFVRGPPLPAEPEQQVVEMVFEAPPAASPAVASPGVSPAEPAPQPPEQTPKPPQAEPAQTEPPAVSSLPQHLPAPPLPAVTAPREPPKPSPPRQAVQKSRPAAASRAPVAPPPTAATAANRQAAPSAASPTQTVPSAGTSEHEVSAAPVDGAWQQALGAWLATHKTYPEQARRRGEEGRVAIRFTVNRAGRVLDVDVVRGSGSPLLDAAASTLLRGAALPPFAASMPEEQVTVTVQLRYSLAP